MTIDTTLTVFLPAWASKVLDESDELFGEMVNLCLQEKLKSHYRGGQYNSIE